MFDSKKAVGVIVSKRGKSDVEAQPEVEAPGSDMDAGLKEAAHDVLRAIEAKSPMDLARALRAAYDCCESAEPQEQEE